jgi:hypothetical protein
MENKLWPLVASTIATGGESTIVAYGPMLGGIIQNPLSAADQGIAVAENILVSLIPPAETGSTTTFPLIPGQTYSFPTNFAGTIAVNAATGGHRFSGVVIQETPNYAEFPVGTFPPLLPVTLDKVIGSYLYQQYNDDEDLIAFVMAFNQSTQAYITWFATVMLSVYVANPMVTGKLLDWVGEGLYGMKRTPLPAGLTQNLGMLNTIMLNTLPINEQQIIGPSDYYQTDDDLYRRILTWHLYKGDGKIFNIRWLKRRIMRFLTGTDGTEGDRGQTYQVSVTFGAANQVNINLQSSRRYALGGAVIGFGLINTFMPNEYNTYSVSIPISSFVPIFKAAVQAGVLELPFQYSYDVNV